MIDFSLMSIEKIIIHSVPNSLSEVTPSFGTQEIRVCILQSSRHDCYIRGLLKRKNAITYKGCPTLRSPQECYSGHLKAKCKGRFHLVWGGLLITSRFLNV